MTKLHIVRDFVSGGVIAEVLVHESSTVYMPEPGTFMWFDGNDYVVVQTNVSRWTDNVTVYVNLKG